MKAIVGLGNIGGQYEKNRHNVGFLFLDYIKEHMDWWEFGIKTELKSMLLKEKEIVLVKPITMMNLSGESVKEVLNFYKISPQDLIVVHDDLDIVIGEWKCQRGKGPKIHNGIISIEDKIGTKDFWRVRVGVDGRTSDTRKKMQGQDYVLGDFETNEKLILNKVFEQIFDYLEGEWF